ncbi:MAG: hypothetical protein KDA86_14065 [Planctomycetaceae bacterium]|nr:hypothetical protein [Planctomycetaceae bacterium]
MIQTIGNRCVLQLHGDSSHVLLKCPGLYMALICDVRGIRVTSGCPMVDVRGEVTGRYVDDVVPLYDSVFGDITEIIVYSEDGVPIPIDLDAIKKLSASDIENCEYFERRDGNTELRAHLLRQRQSW